MTVTQQQAFSFSSPRLAFPPRLIRASAGSGKTFDLTTRLIKLLLCGEKAERILATTFTRKAAAEILTRVIQRLAEAGLSSKTAAGLGQEVQVEELDPGTVLGCLERLADEIHLINICTLDSWFFKIAQAFPLELGLDPAPSMLDEDERERLLSQSIGQMLRIRAASGGDEQALRFFNRGAYTSRIAGKLRSEIGTAPAVIRYLPKSIWSWIEVDLSQYEELLETARTLFAAFETPQYQNGTPKKNWISRLEDIRSALEAGNLLHLPDGRGPVDRYQDGSHFFDGYSYTPESLRAFEALCRLISLQLLAELHLENLSAGQLIDEVYREFDQLMAGERKLGFDELKRRLLHAALGERSADIYYRLDRKISHLLLDEFQDTSLFEWQILEPFVGEILAKSGQDTSFFCVGDVKQAIYGWRGGCAELFRTLKQRWDQLRVEGKNESRRSSPAVIDAVNRVFGGLKSNSALERYSGVAAEWAADFELHSTTRNDVDGRAELWLAGSLDSSFPSKEQTYIAACEKIRELYEADSSRTIGVLARSNKTVLTILFHLARLYPWIPASEESGNPLTDSLPVSVILSLLKIVDHPADTISRFHLASSPLGRLLGYTVFNDDEATYRLIGSLRREAAEMGLGPLLSRLNRELTAGGLTGARDSQRLARLVELGYQFDRRGRSGGRIGEFIAYVKRRKVDDAAGVAVRVMTIHGSKGLEFDAVILADLNADLVNLRMNRFLVDLALDGQEPRATAYRSFKLTAFDPQLDKFMHKRAEEEVKSELCNLYVAMTRARDELIMIAPDTKEFRGEAKATKVPRAARFSRILFQAFVGEPVPVPEKMPPLRLVYPASAAPRRSAAVPRPKEAVAGTPSVDSMPTPSVTMLAAAPRSLMHESPSGRLFAAAETGPDSIRRLFEPVNLGGLKFGTAVHRAFEQIDWIDGAVPSPAAIAAGIGEIEKDEQANKAAAVAAAALSNPEVCDLFSRNRYLTDGADSVEAFCEIPFSFLDGRSVISGTIDRLAVAFSSGRPVRAEVIDFKTDSAGKSADDQARIRAKYAPQVEDYIKAAGRLTGLGRDKIKGTLVLTSSGSVVDI